eukprot:COSAG01_NODE_34583_length_545_cov_0.878924_1_plen_66_part_10
MVLRVALTNAQVLDAADEMRALLGLESWDAGASPAGGGARSATAGAHSATSSPRRPLASPRAGLGA